MDNGNRSGDKTSGRRFSGTVGVPGTGQNVRETGFCDQVCANGAGSAVVYPDCHFIILCPDSCIWENCGDFYRRSSAVLVLYGRKYFVELLFRLCYRCICDIYLKCAADGEGVFPEALCSYCVGSVAADPVSGSVCRIFYLLSMGDVEERDSSVQTVDAPDAASDAGGHGAGAGLRDYHCVSDYPLPGSGRAGDIWASALDVCDSGGLSGITHSG